LELEPLVAFQAPEHQADVPLKIYERLVVRCGQVRELDCVTSGKHAPVAEVTKYYVLIEEITVWNQIVQSKASF
jgi:hypothetical protein